MSQFVPTSTGALARRALTFALSAVVLTTLAGCGDDPAPATGGAQVAPVGALAALQTDPLAKVPPPSAKVVRSQDGEATGTTPATVERDYRLADDEAAGGFNLMRRTAQSTGWALSGGLDRTEDDQGVRTTVTGTRTLDGGTKAKLTITLVAQDKIDPLPKGTYLLKIAIETAS